jgi:hypothetical protein
MKITIYWYDIEEKRNGEPFSIDVDSLDQIGEKAINFLGNAVKYFSERDLRYAKDEAGTTYLFNRNHENEIKKK